MNFKYYEAASHAEIYNKFRPSPPQQLAKRIVNYLTEKVLPPFEKAIDVGCGGGQSTEILAPFFKKVQGFDPCESQVAEATKRNKFNNITYRVGDAEQIDCPDASVEVVTTCQACHWFDLPKFYAELERILVPGGVIAMYGYLLPQPRCGDCDLSDIVKKFYCDTLGDYVLPQSKMVYLDNYRSEPFNNIPFITEPLVREEFTQMLPSGTVSDLVGYASSWSGFQNLQKHVGEDKALEVLSRFQTEVMTATGSEVGPADTHLDIQYVYFLLMGRKPSC